MSQITPRLAVLDAYSASPASAARMAASASARRRAINSCGGSGPYWVGSPWLANTAPRAINPANTSYTFERGTPERRAMP